MANARPGRVPSASHTRASTSPLYDQFAISSISSFEVGQSTAERRVPGVRGVATVVASVRLNHARMELMNASWDIEIVRVERSRSGSMPSTHLTSPKSVMPYFASTLVAREVSSFLEPIATQSSTQKPAAAKVAVRPGTLNVYRWIVGRCCESLTLHVSVGPFIPRSPSLHNPYKPSLRPHTQSSFPGAT